MREHGRIVATIEARMTSSRLPGKVMLEARGKPMIAHLIDRLRRAKSIDQVVLATTVNRADDCLVELARAMGIGHFRGSETDVMTRVIGAAESAGADIVVEITGDCPVIDPGIVEQTLQMFLHNDCDYVSNAHVRSYPDGMDCQVFKLETLKKSAALTDDPLDHEHVTLHIRRHPELFRPIYLVAPPDLSWPELGLVLDEPRDYELLKQLIGHFGNANPYFSCLQAVTTLRQRPDWIALNAGVYRKGDE